MTWRAHVFFWTAILAISLLFIWLLGDVLLPFVAGAAVAYLLNPVVKRLMARGLSRTASVVAILAGFIMVMAVLLALIVPTVMREMSVLIVTLPDLFSRAQLWVQQNAATLRPILGDRIFESWTATLSEQLSQALRIGIQVLGRLVSGGQAALSFVTFVALMPVVAFYMMKEWPKITHQVDDLLPLKSAGIIRQLLTQIDKRLSSFIRGQLLVCFILGAFYSVALSLAGLNYAVLIGVLTGVLSLIPFVGSTFGLLSSAGIALSQVGDEGWIVLALALSIFAIGQFVEGNFITPRIVGNSVGLHPLWIIFALLAGGSLYGLLGMLIAVPMAAAISVLVTFGIHRYKASPYYREGIKPGAAAPKGADHVG